jgi:hypothetical protein
MYWTFVDQRYIRVSLSFVLFDVYDFLDAELSTVNKIRVNPEPILQIRHHCTRQDKTLQQLHGSDHVNSKKTEQFNIV